MRLRHDDLIVVRDYESTDPLSNWYVAKVLDIDVTARTVAVTSVSNLYNYPSLTKTIAFEDIEKTPQRIVALTLSRYIQWVGAEHVPNAVANVVKALNTYAALWAEKQD